MKRILLALTGGLLLNLPLQAQTQARPRPLQAPPITLVSISGLLAPVRAGDPPLPFEVLAQLERDPFLARMRTEARIQTGPAFLVTYAFPSVDAYRAWAETPQTRQLLDALRQRLSQFELTVSLTRSTDEPVVPVHGPTSDGS